MSRDSTAIVDLKAVFAEARLPEPPIPDGLASALMKQGEWCWATRPIDPMDMYLFRRYPDELFRWSVRDVAPEDYIAISHAGHGANSYFLTYQLVLGRIAVLVQVGWGGAYMDAEACRGLSARHSETLVRCSKPLSRC